MNNNAKFIQEILPIPINVDTVKYKLNPSARAHAKLREERRILQESGPCTLVMNYDLHGYGDTIVAAWIGEGAKGFNKTVEFKAQRERKNLLQLLGQKVVNDSLFAVSHAGEYTTGIYSNGSPPFVVARALLNGVPTMPLRPYFQLSDDNLDFGAQHKCDVLIAPQTHGADRRYPREKWNEVFSLLKSHGLSFKIVGTKDGFIEKYKESIVDIPFSRLGGLLRNCKVFLGPDSGPAHLAGTLGTKSVVLLGKTTEDVFTHTPSVNCVATSRKELFCSGCWSQYGRKPECSYQCQALNMISPITVVDAVKWQIDFFTDHENYSDDFQHNNRISDMIRLHNGKYSNSYHVECDRHKSLDVLLTESFLRWDKPQIAFCGHLKSDNDWETHGMVPYLLAYFCEQNEGELLIYEELKTTQFEFTKKSLDRFQRTTVINDRFVSNENTNIVYLDGDTRHFTDLELKKGSLVVIDDMANPSIMNFVMSNLEGYEVLYLGYQIVLEKK